MDWKEISRQKDLSEEFMREHQNVLDWYMICLYHKHLSESFILEMKKRVNWNLISARQRMSLSFIKKHMEYMNIFRLKKNPKLQTFTEEQWKEIEIFYQHTLERYILFQDEIQVDGSMQVSLIFRNEFKKTKTYTSIEAIIKKDSESKLFVNVSLLGHKKAHTGVMLTPPVRLMEKEVCQNEKEKNILKNAIQYFLHQKGYEATISKIH